MKKKSINIVLINGSIVVLIFLLMVISVAFFIKPFLKVYQSRNWLETPCVILRSEVILVNSDAYAPQKNTYKIQINFNYIFDGQSYIGSKYNFDEKASLYHNRKEDIVSAFPVGLKTKCFVNPKEPSTAVLYRSPSPEIWFILVPIIMLIGNIFLFYNFRIKQKLLLENENTPQSFKRREYKKNK